MRMTGPRAVAALALVVVLMVAAAVALRSGSGPEAPPGPPPNQIVPDQLVARLATEALGRAPRQDEWQRATEYFRARGCTADSVAGYAADVYGGGEFESLGYDAVERAIALYRGVLAREPDPDGLSSVATQLRDGREWADVVGGVLGSEELRGRLVPAICSPDSPAYGPVADAPPPDVAPVGEGFSGDQAALQQALNQAAPDGTVTLARHAIVRLSSILRIPAGVTLTTAGDPSPERYASMGRLVRAGPSAEGIDPVMIDLGAGARLQSVWVDAGRDWIGSPTRSAVSVRINADGGAVEDSKLSEPLGGGNLFVSGPQFGVPCRTAEVRGNLLTSYSSEHTQGRWADGISVACEETTVEGNAVIDATDVAIILYRVPGGRQASVVADNVVVAAGRSAYGALAADPLTGAGETWSFEGSEVRDNTLWTGARTHVDIGLAAGTREWFGGDAAKGTGASFTGNTTGALAIRSTYPIAVGGMLDATVQQNRLRGLPSDPLPCPPAPVAASLADGWASGSIQGPVTNLPLSGCFGEGLH